MTGDEVLDIRDLAVEALYTVTMAEHANDDLERGERLAQARRDVAEVVARVEDVAAALGVAIGGEDRPQPPARRRGHAHERDRDR